MVLGWNCHLLVISPPTNEPRSKYFWGLALVTKFSGFVLLGCVHCSTEIVSLDMTSFVSRTSCSAYWSWCLLPSCEDWIRFCCCCFMVPSVPLRGLLMQCSLRCNDAGLIYWLSNFVASASSVLCHGWQWKMKKHQQMAKTVRWKLSQASWSCLSD